MNLCYLCLCNKEKQPNHADVSFHKFPVDKNVREKWIYVCGLNINDNVSNTKICSRHFTADCYRNPDAKSLGQRLVLMPNAVPTVSILQSLNIQGFANDTFDENLEYATNKNGTDLNKICRICFQIPRKSVNLFQNDNDILNRIYTIASIQLEKLDHISEIICDECLDKINICFNFRNLIRKSSDTFTLQNIGNDNETQKNCSVKDISSNTKDIQLTQPDIQLPQTDNVNNHQLGIPSKKNKRTRLNKLSPDLHGICHICGKWVRKENLMTHIEMHSTELQPCSECGFICKNKSSLKFHIAYNHREKKCICHICGKAYTLMGKLRRHVRFHENPEMRKKDSCTICGMKMFVSSLKRHMNNHIGEKTHICPFCHKEFLSTPLFRSHVKLHTGGKPHLCKYCKKTFSFPMQLRKHAENEHGISNVYDMYKSKMIRLKPMKLVHQEQKKKK